MMKVLFISQWYPHRYDKMAGLFVQKHAEAVSLFCDVRVLYVHADETISNFEMEKNQHSGFQELIVYFPNKKDQSFYTIRKTINYLIAYKRGFELLKAENFTPEIIHANILTRTGFIAYFLKLWKGIPYVVTEHWSRYLASRNTYNGTIRKLITRIVVKNAEAILPVSKSLENSMLSHNLFNKNYTVVNNVVDDYFFKESLSVHRTKKRILHVSCFDEQAKNVKGIIRSIYELSKIRQDFELILIGTGIDFESVYGYAQSLDFQKGIIHFLGEKTPEEVANWMQNSDFFVLFSNYENSPVVIAESLVCGKPVISTNVGGISELINESNGILIEKANETELIEQMNKMLDHFEDYDSQKIISDSKDKFSYESVGLRISKIYTGAIV